MPRDGGDILEGPARYFSQSFLNEKVFLFFEFFADSSYLVQHQFKDLNKETMWDISDKSWL